MVFFNYSTMQMAAKVVFYGPGLCGKTTNLQYIFENTSKESRGEMVSLATETDRTLFFDLLPIDVGSIAGFSTRIQLYTVPGQVFYNTTRKLVLKGVDGVVFVADSQRPMLQANVESFQNLEDNLAEMGLSVETIPVVIQYNKRDLPNICTVDELNAALNQRGFPWVEGSAINGMGVFETLKVISKTTLLALKKRLTKGRSDSQASGARPAIPPRPAPAPPARPLTATGPRPAVPPSTQSLRDSRPVPAAPPRASGPHAIHHGVGGSASMPTAPTVSAPVLAAPPVAISPAPVASAPSPRAEAPMVEDFDFIELDSVLNDEPANSSTEVTPPAAPVVAAPSPATTPPGAPSQAPPQPAASPPVAPPAPKPAAPPGVATGPLSFSSTPTPTPVHPAPTAPASPQPAAAPRSRAGGIDALAELEKIRKQALHPTPASPQSGRNGKEEISRDVHLHLRREDFQRARRFTVTLQVEDDQSRVVDEVRRLEVDIENARSLEKILLRLNIALNPT